jgi:hypothetical protein
MTIDGDGDDDEVIPTRYLMTTVMTAAISSDYTAPCLHHQIIVPAVAHGGDPSVLS